MTLPAHTTLEFHARQPQSAAEVMANVRAVRSRLFPPAARPQTKSRENTEPPIPETRQGQIIHFLRKGMIQSEIARITGASRKTVRLMARRLAIPTDSRTFCDDNADEIRRLFDAGMSCRSISFHLGLSRGAVGRYVKAQGWTR